MLLKTSNTQKLQNYMIPEKFYSFYIKRNICSTTHYVLLQEGDSQLQYWNYFMYLIGLLIWVLSMPLQLSNLPGLFICLVGWMNYLWDGSPEGCNPVTHNGDKNDGETEYLYIHKVLILQQVTDGKSMQKPLHLICLHLIHLAWEVSNSALYHLVPVCKSVLNGTAD